MNGPKRREPEPSFGPDEEGDVPIRKRAVSDDCDSWVHVCHPQEGAPKPAPGQ